MTTTKFLAAADVATIIRSRGLDALMDDLISRLEQACREFRSGAYAVPARSGFHYSTPTTGLIEWMPVMEKAGGVTVKLVAYHPENPRTYDLPTILSSMLVFDTSSGHLQGLVDGTFLTALRTGAASAVASRVLAAAESRTLGLIGCGAQAVTQVHALTRLFPIRKICYFDIDESAIQSFPNRLAALALTDIDIVVSDPAKILAVADILCTSTSVEIAEGPVFADGPTQSHLHINAVGSDFPGKTELPRKMLARALVSPDFRAQAILEGECQQMREDEIGPELAELVRDAESYETARETLTVFDSTGWALEDHIAAQLLLEAAEQIGVGSEIALESLSEDPKDPYAFAFAEEGALRLTRTMND